LVALAAVAAIAVVALSAITRAESAAASDCPAVENSAASVAATFLRLAERRDWRCTGDLTTARVRFPVDLPRPLRTHHVFSTVGDGRRLVVKVLLGSSEAVMPAYELRLINRLGRWRVDGFERNA
jgi:hypothetical protein